MKTIFKSLFYTGILIILIGILAVLAVIFVNKKINNPLNVGAAFQIFEVKNGEGAKEIAENLENQNLISNKNYFLLYLWQSSKSARLQAGGYSLSAAQSIKDIADKIAVGEAIKKEITVTIPEGFRMSEIEKRLVENKIIGAGALVNYEYDATNLFLKYGFLDSNCYQICNLEGYLFPDTYNFSTEKLPLDTNDVIAKFLDNFYKKTENSREQARLRGLDFRDIVIMASILEKEVRTPEDMKKVAGILWKRAEIAMPLQVDATIAYVTGKKTGEITYDDLKINSPFNTYLNKWLPPTPISNPGLVALESALNSTKSDYLYYLSKPTGETVFSETIEEHNRAKNLYLR